MKISIIIPTYNRKNKLEKCLHYLQKLEYPKQKREIIVVNDVSGDGTKELLERKKKEMQNLKVVNRENKRGIGSARNSGLEKAKGEYIFFTDDDCIVPKDWIQKHFEVREKHNVDVVNGVQYPIDINWVEAYKIASHWKHYQNERLLKKPNSVDSIKTNNLSVKKQILDEVGYFNEEMERAEDTELGRRILKAGYTVVTDPSLRVKHLKNDSVKEYLITQYKLGQSLNILEEIHESVQNDRMEKGYIWKAWGKYIDLAPPYLAWIFPLIALSSTTARRIGQRVT